VLEARDALGTEALAGGTDAAARHWDPASGGIPNFDPHVQTRSGEWLWVNVSTIVFDPGRVRVSVCRSPSALLKHTTATSASTASCGKGTRFVVALRVASGSATNDPCVPVRRMDIPATAEPAVNRLRGVETGSVPFHERAAFLESREPT
jgi:hypothetical protein